MQRQSVIADDEKIVHIDRQSLEIVNVFELKVYDNKGEVLQTWVFYDTGNSFSWRNTTVQTLNVSFTSNGQAFTSIKYSYASNSYWYMQYDNIWAYDNDDRGGWVDEAYRTIVLDEPASGDLLTFLQANAVKQ